MSNSKISVRTLTMLALLVAGKVSGTQALIAIGVGLAFAFSISMLAELGAYFYCEKRN